MLRNDLSEPCHQTSCVCQMLVFRTSLCLHLHIIFIYLFALPVSQITAPNFMDMDGRGLCNVTYTFSRPYYLSRYLAYSEQAFYLFIYLLTY